MRKNKKYFTPIACIITCSLVFSCSPKKHDAREVELAMQKYNRLIQQMDEDSIAMLYTPDGELGDIAHGRDSIRSFLATFKKYHVLSQSSITDSLIMNNDSAVQKGKYRQVVITPAKDTATVRGEFTADWIWSNGEGWLINKMETRALK